MTNGRHGGFSLRAIIPHLFVGLLCIAALVTGVMLPSHNPTSAAIALFFVATQLVIITAMIIGAERSDRLASRNEAEEPTAEETVLLLEDYLANHRNRETTEHAVIS